MTGLIRRAGPADAAAVRALTRAVYAKWIAQIGREPLPMQADYERAVAEHWIDLLEIGGQLVALIETIPKSDHLYIQNIAVAEAVQGQGLARHLIDHAAQLARRSGLAELRLLTNKAFASNVDMYCHLGFELCREEPFPGGGSTVHFRKAVS